MKGSTDYLTRRSSNFHGLVILILRYLQLLFANQDPLFKIVSLDTRVHTLGDLAPLANIR